MIAIDWGTSSLRGYLLDDASGQVLEQRRSDLGILACQGRFAATLATLVAGWSGPIVLCGMIGSRNGWLELPYLPVPADADALAAAMQHHENEALSQHALWFVPGVAVDADIGVPDVMRGEETQLVALMAALDGGPHLACLPGTHSKWSRIENGRLVSFATVMTGELYAVLRQHSILGKLMSDDTGELEEGAFALGLERSGEPGGLSHHLFGTRTLGLFDKLAASALPSYLSGLLIGHEIRGRLPIQGQVHLIGSHALAQRYRLALGRLRIQVTLHPESLTANGLYQLARRRGLLAN